MSEGLARQSPIKVSHEGDQLITSGANFLGMTKKDLVEQAVAFYLDARREEMQARMQGLLSRLDGTRAARVSLLTGIDRETLERLGGVPEEEDGRRPSGTSESGGGRDGSAS
ncbi:hypothetical protein [Streptomyces montanisoli]|uniref:Uncharacterized protein n=1 Tax=Streptomyces montanisoli TaxID=2798581 RepID=A0A940M989_9ACTN|nr:hypothetical protein [Streptomyces montanisoli]MBP0458624.1 hypothetical protein [Streptomyces montanisoli]